MKKFKKVFLFVLLMIPAIILSACVTPPSYLITTSTSDRNLGRVTGGSSFAQTEGTKITLIANENDSQQHPFVCWVKDYHKVCSTEKELSLTYNENDQGHYTAIFDDELNKIQFCTLSEIEISATGNVALNYTLNYSSSASGSNNYKEFTVGSCTSNQSQTTDYSAILYFGPAGSDIDFKFQILLSPANTEEATTTSINLAQKIEKESFDKNSSFEFIEETTNFTIRLKFEKVSYSLYRS